MVTKVHGGLPNGALSFLLPRSSEPATSFRPCPLRRRVRYLAPGSGFLLPFRQTWRPASKLPSSNSSASSLPKCSSAADRSSTARIRASVTCLMDAAREYQHNHGRRDALTLVVSPWFTERAEAHSIDLPRWRECAQVHQTAKLERDDRGLSAMRQWMADRSDVLVALGGRWWLENPAAGRSASGNGSGTSQGPALLCLRWIGGGRQGGAGEMSRMAEESAQWVVRSRQPGARNRVESGYLGTAGCRPVRATAACARAGPGQWQHVPDPGVGWRWHQGGIHCCGVGRAGARDRSADSRPLRSDRRHVHWGDFGVWPGGWPTSEHVVRFLP